MVICWVLSETSSSLVTKCLNVLIVRVQSLSVNVLPVSLPFQCECSVSLKYEYWQRVRRRGDKLLKNTGPPHWLHVQCRGVDCDGPVAVGLTDMWCCLNCFLYNNRKSQRKKHFLYCSFYYKTLCMYLVHLALFSVSEKVIICAC